MPQQNRGSGSRLEKNLNMLSGNRGLILESTKPPFTDKYNAEPEQAVW